MRTINEETKLFYELTVQVEYLRAGYLAPDERKGLVQPYFPTYGLNLLFNLFKG